MRISLALLLAPWVSAKQFYYCSLIGTANCMGILVACEEDDYDLGMGEEAIVPLVSSKGFLWLNHYEQEQPVTYLSITYYTLTMDYWPGELWDFDSSDLDLNFNDITLAEMITAQILIGLLWLLF